MDANFLATWSATRQDVAWIVSVGLRPAVVGNVAPPRMARFGTSCDSCQRLTTDESGSWPIRAPPNAWVLGDVGAGGFHHSCTAPAAVIQPLTLSCIHSAARTSLSFRSKVM